MFTRVLIVVLITMAVQPIQILRAAPPTRDPVTAALLRLYVIRRDGDRWRNFLEASAFFVDEQGTALTAGLVARPVRERPDTYRIIAIREGALFGATLVCAPSLTPRPGPLADDELEKNIAVIRITELDLPFDTWRYAPADGEPVIIGRKHRGRLPVFQPLVIGADPQERDGVRIAAYGRLLQLQPLPESWSADGQVTRVFKGHNGIPVFAADFGAAHVNWINGAVIVHPDGHVAGLSAWSRSGPPAEVVAISASALREPCR